MPHTQPVLFSLALLSDTNTNAQVIGSSWGHRVLVFYWWSTFCFRNCSGRLSMILALLQCQDSIRTTIQMLMIFLFQVQVQVQVQMTNIQQSSPDYSESTRQNLAPTSHHQDWSLEIFFGKISYFQSSSYLIYQINYLNLCETALLRLLKRSKNGTGCPEN